MGYSNRPPPVGWIVLVVFIFMILVMITIFPWTVDSFVVLLNEIEQTIGTIGTWAIIIGLVVIFVFCIIQAQLSRIKHGSY